MKTFAVSFLVLCYLTYYSNGDEVPNTLNIFKEDATTNSSVPAPNTTVCYDLVGCFDNNPPFNNSANYLPIPPEELNTNFVLFTSLKGDTQNLTYLDQSSIIKSKYNKLYPLKIVIHGFQNTGETPWVPEMARNLLTAEREKVNVITVDWGIGAVFPLYFNASANTRLVGRQTCLLIKQIRKTFYNDVWSKDFNIHCIGHSLGAHTCGYASSYCDSKFDRITAMDPAGPNFEGTDIKVRVDPSDAKFVDVIHSNGDNLITLSGGSFGMQAACGHVDFYPNGGKQQPGCPGLLDLIGGLFSNASAAFGGVSCSHGRAVEYFSESIINQCAFIGYPCDSIENFEKGNCLDCSNGGCDKMGYYASVKSRGIKYLLTHTKTPFCGQAHVVEITISDTNVKTNGEINMILEAGLYNQTVLLTQKLQDFVAGNTYKKVIATDIDLRYAGKSSLQFTKKAKPLFGADPNAPQVKIDKIKISNAEIQSEVFSQCNRGFQIQDKQILPVNFKYFDCQFTSKADDESAMNKFFKKFMSSNKK